MEKVERFEFHGKFTFHEALTNVRIAHQVIGINLLIGIASAAKHLEVHTRFKSHFLAILTDETIFVVVGVKGCIVLTGTIDVSP